MIIMKNWKNYCSENAIYKNYQECFNLFAVYTIVFKFIFTWQGSLKVSINL